MHNLETLLPTDVWVGASWENYLQTVENPAFDQAKGYYHKRHMRVEMSPVGHDHAADNSMMDFVVRLYCTLEGIAFKGLVNCSYRKTGVLECQPDLSYYLQTQAQVVPWGTAVVDLNHYPAPNLVIEISVSSLLDDQGNKRSLYEELGVTEYWVVDVQAAQVLAYSMADRGSRRIDQSQVLAGLSMATLTKAMQRSREHDQAQVGAWLLQQFPNH